jgi:hypothetical protein
MAAFDELKTEIANAEARVNAKIADLQANSLTPAQTDELKADLAKIAPVEAAQS